MPDTLDAVQLRRLAIECATRAYDRERYLKMQESLLALAESADWLAGKKTSQSNNPPIAC